MKMKSKTTATLLIAIFMISIFAVAITVYAEDIVEVTHLGADGWILWDTRHDGIVDFVAGPVGAPLGEGSLHLECTENDPDKAGIARLGSYGSIVDISGYYNWYRTSSWTGFQAPAFKLCVDTDGDEVYDKTLVYEPYFQDGFVGGEESDLVWFLESFDMNTGKWWLYDSVTKAGYGGGGVPGAYGYNNVLKLSEWLVDETFGAALSSGTIVALQFQVGSWNAKTNAYVDDFYFSVLGYRTNFDPPTQGQDVNVFATGRPPVISIDITPKTIDFGTIIAGESSTRTVTISNTGESSFGEKITVSIIGDDQSFYEQQLTIGGASHDGFILILAKGASRDRALVLTIPKGSIVDTYTATLVFWAEEAPA